MGFLQLLIGCDKYSIFVLMVGDELLNLVYCMVLIMLICNEDVDCVFVGLWVIWELVKVIGNVVYFDVYIFSDSYNFDICVVE